MRKHPIVHLIKSLSRLRKLNSGEGGRAGKSDRDFVGLTLVPKIKRNPLFSLVRLYAIRRKVCVRKQNQLFGGTVQSIDIQRRNISEERLRIVMNNIRKQAAEC